MIDFDFDKALSSAADNIKLSKGLVDPNSINLRVVGDFGPWLIECKVASARYYVLGASESIFLYLNGFLSPTTGSLDNYAERFYFMNASSVLSQPGRMDIPSESNKFVPIFHKHPEPGLFHGFTRHKQFKSDRTLRLNMGYQDAIIGLNGDLTDSFLEYAFESVPKFQKLRASIVSGEREFD